MAKPALPRKITCKPHGFSCHNAQIAGYRMGSR